MTRCALPLVLLLAAGCNFTDDLRICREQGRCTPADAGADGGPGRVGLCDRGVCWESPTPTSLELNGVAAAGPDDWWFSSSHGLVFHRLDGGWSMAFVGNPPTTVTQRWQPVTGAVSCVGKPWFAVARPGVVTSYRWTLVDGGFLERERIADLNGNNDAYVSASWSGWQNGDCAWGGSAQQGAPRPWFAEGLGHAPTPLWELPELPDPHEVTAIAGTGFNQLWLAVSGDDPVQSGIFRAADGGFLRVLPRPPTLTRIAAMCETPGGLVVASPEGTFRVALDGGWAQLDTGWDRTGVACLDDGYVSVGRRIPGVRRCLPLAACDEPFDWQQTEFSALGQWDRQLVATSTQGDVVQLVSPMQTWSSGNRKDLTDIWVNAAGEAYAVGPGVLLRRTRDGWTTVRTTGIDGASTIMPMEDGRVGVLGDGLAVWVKPDGTLEQISVLDRLGGSRIQTGFPMRANTARQAPDGSWWVVGRVLTAGQLFTLHLVGGQLIEMPIPDPVPTPTEMFTLAFSGNEGWAAGDDARVWHADSAGNWTIQWKAIHNETFHASVAARGVVWVAGTKGKAARMVDGGWTPRDFPDPNDDIRLLYDAPDTLHAVGILHRYHLDTNGVEWIAEPELPIDGALGQGTTAGDRGWIVGSSGTIVSFPK